MLLSFLCSEQLQKKIGGDWIEGWQSGLRWYLATKLGNVTGCPQSACRHNLSSPSEIANSLMAQHLGASSPLRVEFKKKNGIAHMLGIKFKFFGGTSRLIHRNPQYPDSLKEGGAFCDKTGLHRTGAAKCFQSKEDHSHFSRSDIY